MRLEILCIGDEILSGQVQDQNSFFLAKELFRQGIEVQGIVFVKDQESCIQEQVKLSLKRADFLILTGGMGDTLDDHTKRAIANLFDEALVFDKAIAEDLKQRFGLNLKSLEHQSMVFKGGAAYPNPLGTAPFLILDVNHSQICLLPGVPRELQAMYNLYLKKMLDEKNEDKSLFLETLHFCNMKESDLDPYIRKLAQENADISFGIYPRGKIVSLTLKSRKVIAKSLIQGIKNSYDEFFEASGGLIEEALVHLLEKKEKTLCFAESCSGGNFVARLTKISGASKILAASFVTYSNQMKHDLLQVDIEALDTFGAVSEVVVKQMAQGALEKTNADIAIASSGVAGPTGGSKQKPVGTVYICIALKEGPIFAGLAPIAMNLNREQIIDASTTFAFSMLYLYLKSDRIPVFKEL